MRKDLDADPNQVHQCCDVRRDNGLEAEPLHLDRHVTPVPRGRLMYLSDGGGRERGLDERRKQFRQRCAQFGADGGTNLVKGHRRQLVLQQLQFSDVGRR